jgi:acyl carrier protein
MTKELEAIRHWIVAKHSSAIDIDLDTDIIENRLIDSLEFAEFLFALEEITGNAIDLERVSLDAFRTLRNIQSHFLRSA